MSGNNEQLNQLRHSTAHVLAAAVLKLWPDTQTAIGPAIQDGFYYDFEFSSPRSEADLALIEQEMRSVVSGWKGFERHEVSADQAQQEFAGNAYKQELIDEFASKGETLTIYQSGAYRDLCRGGHCKNPSREIKHFKLLSLAGAYWRGSEKNKMLTRIYGTVFPTKAELDNHLHALQEAKLRDHRKLGKELEIYTISEQVGKGLILWLPRGTIIKNQIESLAMELEDEFGYERVSTPHVAKEDLYLRSGHLPYYQGDMFPPMTMDDGTFYVKPMNCPMHHVIYLHKPRSYRDLPLRLAEFGTVYRNELSGTLAGLLRVRMLSMNDAHIYCRHDQLEQEIEAVLDLTLRYYKLFGFEHYWFRLSLWSPHRAGKYIDEPKNWEHAERVMRTVLQKRQVPFVEAPDEAAFYGPKIDVQFRSVIGREETLSTIQLDFLSKKRFNLTYRDQRGRENNTVFVIHRAPLSVHERFIAILIEHYGGNFPLWLAPVQLRIASVGAAHTEYSVKLAADMRQAGLRADIDDHNETIGNKIRKAAVERIPYVLVVGDKEMNSDMLAVRIRGDRQLTVMKRDAFIACLQNKVATRDSSLALQ